MDAESYRRGADTHSKGAGQRNFRWPHRRFRGRCDHLSGRRGTVGWGGGWGASVPIAPWIRLRLAPCCHLPSVTRVVAEVSLASFARF